jgi:hypothetical protein
VVVCVDEDPFRKRTKNIASKCIDAMLETKRADWLLYIEDGTESDYSSDNMTKTELYSILGEEDGVDVFVRPVCWLIASIE